MLISNKQYLSTNWILIYNTKKCLADVSLYTPPPSPAHGQIINDNCPKRSFFLALTV